LDVSGSMGSDQKLEQAKTALVDIVQRLQSDDVFNIVLFETGVSVWTPNEMVPVSSVPQAVTYINSLVPLGSTNLNDGMITALNLLSVRHVEGKVPMIVLLTDGVPTVGEVNPMNIRANILAANTMEISIFCLGFGYDLDFNLIRAIALENRGFERRIYVGRDAREQLVGFYEEISTPLLANVEMKYSANTLPTKLSSTVFPLFFQGTELVVAGAVPNEEPVITVNVSAVTAQAPTFWLSTFDVSTPSQLHVSVDRMFAFLKVKQLFKDMEKLYATASTLAYNQTKNQALSLSLEYQFVTPLTALVVTVATNDTNSTLANATATNSASSSASSTSSSVSSAQSSSGTASSGLSSGSPASGSSVAASSAGSYNSVGSNTGSYSTNTGLSPADYRQFGASSATQPTLVWLVLFALLLMVQL